MLHRKAGSHWPNWDLIMECLSSTNYSQTLLWRWCHLLVASALNSLSLGESGSPCSCCDWLGFGLVLWFLRLVLVILVFLYFSYFMSPVLQPPVLLWSHHCCHKLCLTYLGCISYNCSLLFLARPWWYILSLLSHLPGSFSVSIVPSPQSFGCSTS